MSVEEYCAEIKTSDQNYDEIDNQKVVKSKNPRRRKRDFYNSIRNQMEFYFGDANLSKDRFLMQLIKEDPFVPLDVFLKFNKIKKMVTSIEEIVKALTYSELLELNDDKTKVRRITEIPKDRNADNRTIYVESLPPIADHEWVKNVFGRFGSIAYVSLPKFKISKKIKEFGFIEFEKQESLQKTLNTFNAIGNVICVQSTEPEKLLSITSFAREQEEIHANVNTNDKVEENVKDKRPHSPEVDGNSSLEEPVAKRQKTSSAQEENSNDFESKSESEKQNNTETDNENASQKKRKRRRRKKKHQKKTDDFDLSQLKVLPKIEWKKLRNKYLNMQRKKMSEIKQEIRKKHNRPIRSRENIKPEVKKPQSMNFYGAGQDTENFNVNADYDVTNKEERNPAIERIPLFRYEPGLIVRIKLLESCVNVKSFKGDIKQYPGVKYVDVKEGAIEAFVRFETQKHAKSLKKTLSCAEYVCDILSGDMEIEYWNKVMRDREMKLNKEIKVPQKRGREKLAKAVATHIFFKDED